MVGYTPIKQNFGAMRFGWKGNLEHLAYKALA